MLRLDPMVGALFVCRGRRGDLIKVLWWDGQGLWPFSKRLERGRFLWPQAKDGSVVVTAAQLSMLLEGIDWPAPRHLGPRRWPVEELRAPAASSSATKPSDKGAQVRPAVCRPDPLPPSRVGDKWHLDEVVLKITGVKHWLWRVEVDMQTV